MEVLAADFARMCGVSKANISIKIKNGTLIVNRAKRLDTDNPINRAYLEKQQAKLRCNLDMQQAELAITSGMVLPRPASLAESEAMVVPDAFLADSSMILGGASPDGTYVRCSKNGAKTQGVQVKAKNASRKPAARISAEQAMPGTPMTAGTQSSSTAHDMLNMTVGQLVRQHGSIDAIEKYAKILRDLSAADEREQKLQERRLMQLPKDFVLQRFFGYIDQLMSQLLDMPESVCDSIIASVVAEGEEARLKIIHLLSDSVTKCISGAKEHLLGELHSLRGKYEQQEQSAAVIDELIAKKVQEEL